MVHARGPSIPPLVFGDFLTREEFEERYEAMPELKKAELIDGVVYVGSPVSYPHGSVHVTLAAWLGVYRASTHGIRATDNTTVRLDDSNEPQPDLALLVADGKARIDKDKYISGAPDLIIEIALSSRSYDLHQKKNVYQRHGVGTYIVWQVEDEKLRWFELRNGRYEEVAPGPDRVWRSERFPGLWLDGPALARDDVGAVLDTLARGIAARDGAS
jgi:Uma2 family endonuclease